MAQNSARHAEPLRNDEHPAEPSFVCPHCLETVDRGDLGAVLLHQSPTHRFRHGSRRRALVAPEEPAGEELASVAPTALEHYTRCPDCGGVYDRREMGQTAYHSREGHATKNDPSWERMRR